MSYSLNHGKLKYLDQTVEYIFDDPYHNHVHILDDIILSAMHELYEKLGPRDFHDFLIHKSPREKIEITEKIDLNIVYIAHVLTASDFIYYIQNDEVTLSKIHI